MGDLKGHRGSSSNARRRSSVNTPLAECNDASSSGRHQAASQAKISQRLSSAAPLGSRLLSSIHAFPYRVCALRDNVRSHGFRRLPEGRKQRLPRPQRQPPAARDTCSAGACTLRRAYTHAGQQWLVGVHVGMLQEASGGLESLPTKEYSH